MALLPQLDLDARRIETRAQALIRKVGLADEYGETGGLLATYRVDDHALLVQDEAFTARWDVDEDGYLTQTQWDEMHCYILGCTTHGCGEDHVHYELP